MKRTVVSGRWSVVSERNADRNQLTTDHRPLTTAFLLILIDHAQNCLRVRGGDALLFLEGEAQVLSALRAPAGLQLLVAVDDQERLLGRLVVDAVEAVQAEAARLLVRGLREDARGGRRGTASRQIAVLRDEAKRAAHVLYVPDDFDLRAGLGDAAQEALVEGELALDVQARLHLRRGLLPVRVEAEAQDVGEAEERLLDAPVLERHHLLAAVAVEPRGQALGAFRVIEQRRVLLAREPGLHLEVVF